MSRRNRGPGRAYGGLAVGGVRGKRGPATRTLKEMAQVARQRCAATDRGVRPSAKPRTGRLSMKRLIIAVVSLSLGLGGLSGGVLAQTNSGLVVVDDASGTSGTGRNCDTSGPLKDRTLPAPIFAQDVASRSSTRAQRRSRSPRMCPPRRRHQHPEAASEPETTDRAVATATDQDADNEPDELEPGLGLDPTNADTDADGVADGDEPTSTAPTRPSMTRTATAPATAQNSSPATPTRSSGMTSALRALGPRLKRPDPCVDRTEF